MIPVCFCQDTRLTKHCIRALPQAYAYGNAEKTAKRLYFEAAYASAAVMMLI